jgi:hypothetical protein
MAIQQPTRLFPFGSAVILRDEELAETARYGICFAFLDNKVGLSCKGLSRPIKLRLNGDFVRLEPGTFQPLKMHEHRTTILKRAIELQVVLTELVRLEQSTAADDDSCESTRSKLRELYEQFVSWWGSMCEHRKHFRIESATDFRLLSLLALEDDNGTPAAILQKRVHFPQAEARGAMFLEGTESDRAIAAFQFVLADSQRVDLPRIAELADLPESETEAFLIDAGLVLRVSQDIQEVIADVG